MPRKKKKIKTISMKKQREVENKKVFFIAVPRDLMKEAQVISKQELGARTRFIIKDVFDEFFATGDFPPWIKDYTNENMRYEIANKYCCGKLNISKITISLTESQISKLKYYTLDHGIDLHDIYRGAYYWYVQYGHNEYRKVNTTEKKKNDYT